MRIPIIATAIVLAAGPCLAQTSLYPPRRAEQDLQDLSSLMVQRQQDALRQQQQTFEAGQRQFEIERQKAIPIMPNDPTYLGTMFR